MTETISAHALNAYKNCGLEIGNIVSEPESSAYAACSFSLNGAQIFYRKAKITPKKLGQFVTFWQREKNGKIAPYFHTHLVDYFVVDVQNENTIGQFIFPKSALIINGIISTETKEGKRAFRVYPPWENKLNPQATKAQRWQLNYFCDLRPTTDLEKMKRLFAKK